MCLYVFCGSLFIVFIRYTYVEWSVGVGFPKEKNAMRRKKSRMISCFNGYDLSKCGWALPYSAYNSHRSCAFCWTSATVIRLSRHTGQRLYLHNTNFKMFTNIDMYLITIVVRLNEMLLVLFVGTWNGLHRMSKNMSVEYAWNIICVCTSVIWKIHITIFTIYVHTHKYLSDVRLWKSSWLKHLTSSKSLCKYFIFPILSTHYMWHTYKFR